jgi:hypothetical protein
MIFFRFWNSVGKSLRCNQQSFRSDWGLSSLKLRIKHVMPRFLQVAAPCKVFGDIHGQVSVTQTCSPSPIYSRTWPMPFILSAFRSKPFYQLVLTHLSVSGPSPTRPLLWLSEPPQGRRRVREVSRNREWESAGAILPPSIWFRSPLETSPSFSATYSVRFLFPSSARPPLTLARPLPATLLPPSLSYIFNGDWVDRGAHQVDPPPNPLVIAHLLDRKQC